MLKSRVSTILLNSSCSKVLWYACLFQATGEPADGAMGQRATGQLQVLFLPEVVMLLQNWVTLLTCTVAGMDLTGGVGVPLYPPLPPPCCDEASRYASQKNPVTD